MATRLQFGMRWLLLLTFLVAAWAALACSYESFLGSIGRIKAFVVACSGLTAAVVLTAASAAPPVALFHRLLWQPLSVDDYQLISRRLAWWLVWLGACILPLGVIVYYDVVLAERLIETRRGIVLFSVALFASGLILAAWGAGVIVIIVKAARCRCPACNQRLNRINARAWSTECADCQATLNDRK